MESKQGKQEFFHTSKNGEKVAVVGSGITGLTTAITLLEGGYQNVTMITQDKLGENGQLEPTNSDQAVAVWRPYGGDVRFLDWAKVTLTQLKKLIQSGNKGVSWINMTEVFEQGKGTPTWLQGLEKATTPEGVQIQLPSNEKRVIKSSFVPIMDVPIYRKFLFSKFAKLGGKLEAGRVIKTIESFAKENTGYSIILNCTGCCARTISPNFFTDKIDKKNGKKVDKKVDVYPMRGQAIVIAPPPVFKEYYKQTGRTLGFNMEGSDKNKMIYVDHRPGSDEVIIGATEKKGSHDLKEDAKETDELLMMAKKLLPGLAKYFHKSQIKRVQVGLRAGCRQPIVRLEKVGEQLIGVVVPPSGGGYTASYGIAADVKKLCDKRLSEMLQESSELSVAPK